MDSEKSLESVIDGIRARAHKSRRIALILIFVIILLGSSVAILFASLGVPNLIFIGEQSDLSNATIELNADKSNDLIQEITKAIIRIGSVILAVYIIQILVSITRYHLRIADALEVRADCLLLSKGEPEKLSQYAASLSMDYIGFEKIPELPGKELINTVSTLAQSKKA